MVNSNSIKIDPKDQRCGKLQALRSGTPPRSAVTPNKKFSSQVSLGISGAQMPSAFRA